MGIKDYIRKKFVSDSNDSRTEGKRGEDIACHFIKGKGYSILEKNYRSKYGELDIIAEDKKTLCFVEVKSRSRTDHGRPEEFVNSRKQQKLIKTALTYISKNSIDNRDMRFDIVSVDLNTSESKVIKNAFQIPDN